MAIAQLTQAINLQIQGTRQVSNEIRGVTQALDRMTEAFNRSSRNQKQHQKQNERSQQGLSNIQAGLVQLSTWLLNTNVRINNLFDNMTRRFVESETAVNQLKITMGLAGESQRNPMFAARFEEFERFKSTIDELAMTTEYTKREVADAFTALVQSGRSGKEAMKMLHGTLQLATASGGQLDLGQAVNIATLTLGTLGGKVDEVDNNLNMLLKTSQKTKIGFKDLEQVLGSLRATYTRFSESTKVSREAEIMAMAAAARTMGLSAANSGEKIDQFSRQILSLVEVVGKSELRTLKGLKSEGRFSMKRERLLQFFGVGTDLDKLNTEMDTQFKDVTLARDEFVKRQIMEFDQQDQKYKKRTISSLMEKLVDRFVALQETKGADAEAIAKTAFGTEAASFMLKAILKLAEGTEGGIAEASKRFSELVQNISKNNGELVKAQNESLKTLAKRMELVESAEDALATTIFQHDIYANAVLDTYKEMVGATNLLMKNNESLASAVSFIGRTMQVLTGVGTTLGFTLTAMATFSIALKYSLEGATQATKGLGGTLRAFGSMFLKPTLIVLGQMIGGIALLSVGIVALMRHFSGAQGIGEGFSIVLEKIGNRAKAAGGLIQLAFSNLSTDKSLVQLTSRFYELRDRIDELRRQQLDGSLRAADSNELKRKYEELSKINEVLGKSGRKALVEFELGEGGQETISFMAKVGDQLKGLANGFSIIGEAAIQPLMFTLGYIFEGLALTLNLVLYPFRKLAELFGYASDEATFMNAVLKSVGYVLGTILSVYLMSKVWGLFVGTLVGIRNKFTSLGQGVVNYNSSLLDMQKRTDSLNTRKQQEIRLLDTLKLKYLQATNQVTKHKLAIKNLGSQSRTSFQELIISVQTLGGGLATLGGAVSLLGYTFEDETMQMWGNWAMMAGGLVSVLPAILGAIDKMITALIALRKISMATALATLKIWSPFLIVFGALAGLIYYFSNTKPPKVKTPSLGSSGPSSTDDMFALNRIQRANMSTYLDPVQKSPYSVPNTSYIDSATVPYASPTSMNSGTTVVNNFNIREQNINGVQDPKDFGHQMKREAQKGSSLGYDSFSGVNRPR